jgi:uncharacterized protein YdhG (YjbR/CyaY superfamily)
MAMKQKEANTGTGSAGDAAANRKAIDACIAKSPQPARKMLDEIRAIVRANAPAETTEVFSYGMPGFRYKGPLLWYGAMKHHCGFYPGSPPMIQSLATELKDYKTTKGAIQFPYGKPVPAELVKKIVRLRVKENDAREAFGAKRYAVGS